VLVVGVGWSAFVEHRPGLKVGERYGIDVSAHQGPVDWKAVAGDGIDFAYLKATEGGDHIDARFAENWRGARAAGVDRGAYHFFTLCRPGAEQARHFLDVAPDGELPRAVDVELAGNCSARPDATDVERELQAFLDRVGRDTVLYVGHDFADRYSLDVLFAHARWVPRFLRRPSGPWTVWQVSGFAHVHGVSGRADLDVMQG